MWVVITNSRFLWRNKACQLPYGTAFIPQFSHMANENPLFLSASPYQRDVLALPVTDLDRASNWYCEHFEMTETKRTDDTVILERNRIQIGFALHTGGDPSQDGAAIRVRHLQALQNEFEARGFKVSDSRTEERDGKTLQVFFVVAPDQLCYYFYEPIEWFTATMTMPSKQSSTRCLTNV